MKRQPPQHSSKSSGSAGELPDSPDMIWGVNTVLEALVHDPRRVSEVRVLRGKAGPKFQEIIDQARAQNVRLRFVEANRLGVPARTRHQGVAARQIPVRPLGLDELLELVGRREGRPPARILVLDSIQDPRNLGAIFRSALAAGFTAVILTRERSAPLSGTVAATSAGALAQLRICQVVNLAETLKILQKKGFWVFGSVADRTAASIYATDFSVPLCLVIGGEGKGIRPLVRKQCDQLVTIPMAGDFDSLNASVAAAVIMFEIVRQQGR